MTAAEVLLGVDDLHAEMPFFQTLGFRLDMIWPADDPATAIMSGYGLRLRLERGQGAMPGRIRILADDPAAFISDHGLKGVQLASPSGNLVMIAPSEDIPPLPEPERGFAVRRLVDGAEWVIGRAGMRYRDLIPNRLGGSIIASHIRIPEGGPVPDMVHFHRIGFQLIFCHAGWVDLVYEDQGPEFRLSAGDCVIQPPEIRHRVLHASDGLEVIEIGCPAEHVTAIDHEMTLPTPHHRPGGSLADRFSFCIGRARRSGNHGPAPASRIVIPVLPMPRGALPQSMSPGLMAAGEAGSLPMPIFTSLSSAQAR